MDNLRLRNLTTGIVHTNMVDIHNDIEMIFGHKGLFDSILPRVYEAIKPWLIKVVTEKRFWDDKFDLTHVGEFELPEPTIEDREEMLRAVYGKFVTLDENQSELITVV